MGPTSTHLENWDLAAAALQASRSETPLVFLNAYATEGADRHNLTSFSGDALVTAVLIADLPGQESGNSLVPMLWGQKSPSGKLPFTVAKNESDWHPNGIVSDPVRAAQSNFTEKLLIDYKGVPCPGLRYYSHRSSGSTRRISPTLGVRLRAELYYLQVLRAWPTAESFVKVGDSGSSLYAILYTASIRVTNTGKVQGAEVAQLYLSLLVLPPALCSFAISSPLAKTSHQTSCADSTSSIRRPARAGPIRVLKILSELLRAITVENLSEVRLW
ncbi:hypothetical protein C8F04DRAFT_1172743 [Mycena alexandri]|uniref:beta-glucosidase n=1 Tax=Mycena alexandri TaxID=1745969 RepID=A0AAD6XED9_9AGAR|nr:hypothetical protein C8F04DRAFT_1172743 [Mycena alexandri]